MRLINAEKLKEEVDDYIRCNPAVPGLCPKCNSIMICVSTASIPPIITYQCYSCGYTSKPIKEEYNCKILPIELRGKEK